MTLSDIKFKHPKERREKLHSVIHLKTDSVLEKLALIFSPSWLLRKKASAFTVQFSSQQFQEASVMHHITIHPYTGTNVTAIALKNLTQAQISDDIEDIIIHGSIADNTACSYSDFDCLIILKEEVLQSVDRLIRVASKLRKWQKLMLQTDMLQHHGWFVAVTSDFGYWDETYLPIEVFQFSKSLLHKKEYQLKIFANTSVDYKTPFIKLCNELIAVSSADIKAMNSYELKTFISRFFLMPTLYYQAKHKKGIYKRDGFIAVKNDFSGQLWEAVIKLSELRLAWQQPHSLFTYRLIKTFYLWPLNFRKFLYPRAPEHIKSVILQHLSTVKSLLEAMKKNVQ